VAAVRIGLAALESARRGEVVYLDSGTTGGQG